jgi:NitT/TauT family transport system substrate-binding protein
MNKKQIFIIILFLLYGTAHAVDLRVGVVSESVNKWPMWVAEDKGYFSEQGINVELVLTGEATVQVNMLRSGELDLGHQAADHVVRAIEKGDNFVVVHTITRATNDLLVGSGINSYSDLKGKTFALANLNVSYWLMYDKVLRANGVNPGDYQVIANSGGPAMRMEVLREGRADVTYMNPPASIEAEAEGYTRLTSLSEHYPEFPASSIATRRDWAQNHEDILVKYLMAYIRATEWLLDESNRDEALDIAVNIGGHERSTLPGGYEAFVRHGIVRYGTLSPEGYRQISGLLLDKGVIKEISPMEKYAEPKYQIKAKDWLLSSRLFPILR